MRIDFFEEFPTDENLAKAALLSFPSTIYLAARSLEEFLSYQTKLELINSNIEAAYWPILPNSYWVSPFSSRQELQALFHALKNYQGRPLKILIDLELPLLNKKLFFKNALYFFSNKRKIKKILSLKKAGLLTFLTAEYPLSSSFMKFLSRLVGVSYHRRKYEHHHIRMMYTSMIVTYGQAIHTDLLHRIKRAILKESLYDTKLHIGLGTIAKGILGNEPILSPSELAVDLAFLKENGIENAVIFRLGGLNADYMSSINAFSN